MSTECPHCLAPINPKAKKCKSCGEWVSRFNSKSIWTFIWIAFFIGVYAWSRFSADGIANNFMIGREFSKPVSERFEILSHQKMTVTDTVAVIGEIKNKDAISKEMIRLEVRFYDKDNKLVDLGQDLILGDFQAGEVRPFKVTFGCGLKRDTKSYDHYEIKIRN